LSTKTSPDDTANRSTVMSRLAAYTVGALSFPNKPRVLSAITVVPVTRTPNP
jgi:hypothetical protein